jgi:hypothetical protein
MMSETEHVLIRSYLDALSDYEKVNKEAVAIARQGRRDPAPTNPAREKGDAVTSLDDEALREVMGRWHNSLLQVLGTWEQVPHNYRIDS